MNVATTRGTGTNAPQYGRETFQRALAKPVRARFVTGKGGVGKTSVAAGLAAAAAERDGTSVYVEFSDGQSGRRSLIHRQRGVKHVVLDPTQAISEAAKPLFGSSRVARLALNNFAMKPLLNAAPGIRELAVLELARKLVENHPSQEVVFDMPASGHCVAWLKTPRQARRVTATGPLHELCVRLEDELITSATSSVTVVTLPERLVLSETLSLCRTIETEVELPVDCIVVNRMPQRPDAAALRDAQAMTAAGGAEGQAAERLASWISKHVESLARTRDELRQVAKEHGERWGNNGRLLLFPAVSSQPDAATVASWLSEGGLA